MPITNKLNLPQPIVQALMRETYDPGTGDYSATELISPPKISVLKKRHKADIFEDASDLLYSLYGQTMHLILERSGLKCEGYKVENRHYAKFGRWNISAQFDCLYLDGGILSDYKFTSTYSFQKNMDGTMEMKKEWFAQLNIQAEILRRDIGAEIKVLQIVGLLRDWQPSKAAQDPLYPQTQIVIMNIPMATPERTEAYILHRAALHQAAWEALDDDAIPECDKEERWEDDTKYAAIKKGNKRATKVHDSFVAAEAWLQSQKDVADFSLEKRIGFPRRCMGVGGKVYCPAAKFCHHYQAITANPQNWAT